MYSIIMMQYLNAFEPRISKEGADELERDWFMKEIGELLYKTNQMTEENTPEEHKFDDEYINLTIETLTRGINYLTEERNEQMYLSEYYICLDDIAPVIVSGSKATTSKTEYQYNPTLRHAVNRCINTIMDNEGIELEDINDVIMVVFLNAIKKGSPIAIYYPD